ncbi:monovalent cation/H+ antiporter subunit A [Sphingomonas sp. M1-B02]|uniref:monovalent cation/H+ antiporter subunit A n=1 Tax=Sphingomonas sp. M1-B02 TaxID=3114300 RepID=UPI00223F717D|nr:monovalent cation/H+ antiporter subunit A [Sphingomonas sp. S6-11]UZK66334.1 monovalent cation/H+ antiporter subunit A [Sphingomonas sp. S6-11]
MLLVALSLLPFAAALALGLAARGNRSAHSMIAGAGSATGLALVLAAAPGVLAGETLAWSIPWVPMLGLDASLFLDPLGLLFAGLILGIGLLVVIYAHFYLAAREPTGRFFGFLMLFQGAMLGIVLSNNVLLMLVFWELTSLSSFLLIGFWRDKAEARQGARMALAVTGGGGLMLIAGMLLLGQAAGSYELTTILGRGDVIQASPLYPILLVLILLGCFTKSAQFPFHFWLPHAMAAPTPVSAYLHSATMVKAGVFLLARLWPVLAGTEWWFYLVATTGLATMLFGAAVALFRTDLKAILAYSTISQLGLLVMLLGFSTRMAVVACVFHILNHATFKAALFMNAGIVDHETGTRDIRRLGGLAALMPITALLGTLAAASMAGLPPLNGFLSKEMMLEESAHAVWAGQHWLVPLLATVAATLSVAYALRYAVFLYFRRAPADAPSGAHDPSIGMWAPSALLVLLVIALGLLPMTLAGPSVAAIASAVIGGPAPAFSLALWHGFNPALAMSVAAILLGGATLWCFAPIAARQSRLRLPDAKTWFDGAMAAADRGTRRAMLAIHTPSLQRYLFALFATAILLGIDALVRFDIAPGTRPTLPAPPVAILAWAVLIAGVVAVLVAQRWRFHALIFISVVGLVIALGFVHLSAPDLALTQISVEVVTILLMLLALNLLPKMPPVLSSNPKRLRDAILALAGGSLVGGAAWAIMTRAPRDPISDYHWANSYAGGGGTNVVNVILVDFRAFDTLGEIIVLGIAGLAIFALLNTASRGAAGARLRAWRDDMVHSPERHPMMFVISTRILLPLTMLAGIYIFLRGHNQPGGGFIAALVFSIAFLLQYLASGFDWTDRRRKIGEHRLIAYGVLIAVATGAGSLLFGRPLFTSAYGYFHLPLIGEFELATASLFDLGVASVVVGAVMMALAQLSHVAQRAARSHAAAVASETEESA